MTIWLLDIKCQIWIMENGKRAKNTSTPKEHCKGEARNLDTIHEYSCGTNLQATPLKVANQASLKLGFWAMCLQWSTKIQAINLIPSLCLPVSLSTWICTIVSTGISINFHLLTLFNTNTKCLWGFSVLMYFSMSLDLVPMGSRASRTCITTSDESITLYSSFQIRLLWPA